MARFMFLHALALAVVAPLTMGGCASRQKSDTDAILNNDSPYSFHRSIAHTLMRTEQYQKALPHVQRMVRLRPELPEPYFAMARVHLGLGLHDSAKRLLAESLKREERYVPSISLMGVVLDLSEQHAEAETWHRRAIVLSGGDPHHHNNLGFCLHLQARFDEALESYQEGLKYDSGSRRLHNNIGFAYGRLGKLEEAARHFGLAGAPAETDNNIGLVHETNGELDRAVEFYASALRRDPQLQVAAGNLARVSVKLGRAIPPEAAQAPAQNPDEETVQ